MSSGPEFAPRVLREYALLADGERGVLVGPRGDFAWMCMPRWDSDAVFSSLIGGAGLYAVTPASTRFVWGGYYEDRSLIWHSRWVTSDGIVESRDALAFPGDAHTAVIMRRVRAVEGDARVSVVLDPRAGFGHHRMTALSHRDLCWTARSGPLWLRWTVGGSATVRSDGALRALIRLPEGDHRDLVLAISDRRFTGEPVQPDVAWAATEEAWRKAVPNLDMTIADDDARQSYAVMRGLTAASGAMVAAATMSLPERADEGRNYDYRYSWIRDQCYAGEAIATCGPYPLLDDAVRFVADRVLADGPHLKPAYTVSGRPVPDERSLTLPGYPGGSDKVGNWVNQQFQLDAFGEVLLLLAAAERHDHLDLGHWQAVETVVAAIASRWRQADAGIWELDDRHWAHSRLTCAAGLRAIATYAPAADAANWSALADTIVADTARDCAHPSGRWQRAPDDTRVDAALLLPAIRGALPPNDPRSVATLKAVRDELGSGGYVYRFRHDERPLEDAEGAFVLCGFVVSLAAHQQGSEVEANRWFERNRAACGPPGLFAEEYDIREHQIRGNLPQAFVHAALLESARRLAEPWPAW